MKRLLPLAAGALMLSNPVSAEEQTKPNFIMLLADDMGWGDIGNNGHPLIVTPNLDAMADNGMNLSRCYAPCATCSPSRAAILTGRNNLRVGLTSYMKTPADGFVGKWHLLESEITYAEALRDAGYATAHYGKWHVGYLCQEQTPKNFMTPGMAGFDDWFTSHNILYTYDPYAKPPNNKDEKHLYFDNGKFISLKEGQARPELRKDDATIVMDKTLGFIEEQAKAKKPFAVAVWFHHVHNPLSQNPELRKLYPEDMDDKLALYLSNVTAMDVEVGRLREKLRELGIADNTMVMFSSDNGPRVAGPGQAKLIAGEANDGKFRYGPSGSPGPFKGGKYGLWEAGTLVPGVIEWPAKIKAGSTSAVPTVLTDYMPTVLAAAGIPMPNDRTYDGIDINPLLEGKMTERPAPIQFAAGGSRSLIKGKYKLFIESKRNEQNIMLFDLEADPYEDNNIAAKMPEKVESMKAELLSWSKDAEADYERSLSEYNAKN